MSVLIRKLAYFNEYYNFNLHNIYCEISIALQTIRCDLMYKTLQYAIKNFDYDDNLCDSTLSSQT